MGDVEVRDITYLPEGKLDEAINAAAQVVGNYLQQKILEKITQQDPSWPPLAASTIAAKGSSKAWIDTGELFGLIADRGLCIQNGPPIEIEIGIFEDEKGFVAQCLEYGTIHIPERPLFRLVFDTEVDNAVALFTSEINKRLP